MVKEGSSLKQKLVHVQRFLLSFYFSAKEEEKNNQVNEIELGWRNILKQTKKIKNKKTKQKKQKIQDPFFEFQPWLSTLIAMWQTDSPPIKKNTSFLSWPLQSKGN